MKKTTVKDVMFVNGHAFVNDATGAVAGVATSQDKQCPASDTRREEKSREKVGS
jgi:hypothetical protein